MMDVLQKEGLRDHIRKGMAKQLGDAFQKDPVLDAGATAAYGYCMRELAKKE